MDKNKESISIIGCGWLGMPLGKILVDQGWNVKGSTTKNEKVSELESMGIGSFVIRFPTTEVINESLFQTSNLLINLPPGRNNPEKISFYPKAVTQILSEAVRVKTISNIVFISSTSVYGNSADLIDEQAVPDPETDSGKAILEAERLVSSCGIPNIILRFGGLAGPGRHPGRFLAGRKDLEIGDQSINYLHQDDAMGIIQYFLKHQVSKQCYNVVSPDHPRKSEFYCHMAKLSGLEPPTFSKPTNELKKREVSINKLLRETDYEFIHPDPMQFFK